MTLAIAALLAGFLHVFSGPDHLAAIAPYAVQGKARAWRTGVRWGMGHAAGVLGAGLAVLLLRDALSIEVVSAWSERFVGLALLAIGTWGLWTTLARRDSHSRGHAHGHAAFSVGTLHGAAGSAHLLGILPALALPSDLAAGTYLLLFGIGSIAAMGAFASFVGWIAGRQQSAGSHAQQVLLGLSSAIAVVVGCFWILRGP